MLKLYKTSLCDLVAIRNQVNILKWAIDNEFMYGWSTVEESIKGKSIKCLKLVLSNMKKKSIKILKKYFEERNRTDPRYLESLQKKYLIEEQNFFYIPEKYKDHYIKHIPMLLYKNLENTRKMLKRKEEEKVYYNNLIDHNIPVNNQGEFKEIINFYIDQKYKIDILYFTLKNLNKLSEYSE